MISYLTACVLYPLVERWQGRRIREKFRIFRSWMARPFPERRQRACQCLADVLQQAGQGVPYYRELFRAVGFDPEKVRRDPAFLQDLPFLDKAILREQGDRLLHEALPRNRLHPRKTGGSTGPSAFLFYSDQALDWTAAVNLWVLDQAGKPPHRREAHLASRFPDTFPWRDRLRERIKCLALNRVNIATDALDEAGLDRLWRDLKRARAYLVQGHPSTLYAVARHVEDRRYPVRPTFRVFESTGELLDSKKRQTIERAFGCRVIDRYGNAEFGVLAHELSGRAGPLVLDAVAWPESLPTAAGPELVFTGLLNQAMPLIRYRTGDLGELIETASGFHLERLFGRVHDLVRIGNRVYPTHYLQDVLDRLGGVDEFQIEERGVRPPLLRLVTNPTADRPHVIRRLRDWWGDALEVELVGFDGLRRLGGRGKFRHVVAPPTPAA